MKKLAYQVRAKFADQPYKNFVQTVVSDSPESAIEKAKSIHPLSPEQEQNVNYEVHERTVYSTDQILKSDNYPYGRLRCTATHSVEYGKNKGYRTVFQTVNPKNGRLNAPKKSTYSIGLILPAHDENGHFTSVYAGSYNGTESINSGLHFLNDFYDLLTEEQVRVEAMTIMLATKADAKAQCMYCGSTWEDLKPYYDTCVKTLVEIYNNP